MTHDPDLENKFCNSQVEGIDTRKIMEEKIHFHHRIKIY
jgi:hypothetical protein